MHILKHALLFITLLFNFKVFAYPYFSISTGEIGPYMKGQIVYIDVNIQTNLPAMFRMSLHVLIDNSKTPNTLLFSSKYEEYLISNKNYKIKFNTNYLIDGENKIKFQLINITDGRAYSKAEIILFPYKLVSENIHSYNDGNYLKTNYAGKITNNTTIYYDDKTKFSFPNTHYEDNYYRLNLSRYMLIKEVGNITYDEVLLKIYDRKGAFINLGMDFIKRIPLSFKKYNNFYYLDFKNFMYVNPNSMQMSLIPLNGFLQTKYFYFPINQKDKLNNIEMIIEINGYGLVKTNLFIKTNLIIDKSLIGSCFDSDFCIIGGIDNG